MLVDTGAKQSAAACYAAVPATKQVTVCQNGEVTDEAAKAAQHGTPTTDDAKVAEKLRKRLVRQKKRNNKAFKARSVQMVQKIMCA